MGDPLQAPVRAHVLARLCGMAARPIALACAVPAAVAAACGEIAFALRAAAVAAGFLLLGRLCRGGDPGEVRRHEALVVAAAMFTLLPLAMAWPFSAGGEPFGVALFEAVSGITTTGLSMIDLDRASPALLFGRAWLQWIGGLGILLLSLAVLAPPVAGARQLDEKELTREGLGTTRSLARRVVLVHATLTGLGIAVLLALGEGPLRAVCYPLSALSTGGFSPDPDGLGALGPAARAAVLALCVLGAVPALLLAGRMRAGERRVALAQCAALFALVALVTAGLAARGLGGPGLGDEALLAVSAQTTAGFSTVDPGTLDPGAKAWLTLAMLVGGPTGSTAGGVKLLRLLIVFRLVQLAVARTALPRHAVVEPRVAGERIDVEVVFRAELVALLAVGTLALSWLPFVLHGHDPLDSLFEVASALGTVGLSTGLTGADLEPGLAAILAGAMMLGRLEFVALLVMLRPGTWFGPRARRGREVEK
jgi:trk system potassium uptake protein TrkH